MLVGPQQQQLVSAPCQLAELLSDPARVAGVYAEIFVQMMVLD